jgi:hypothetical protein
MFKAGIIQYSSGPDIPGPGGKVFLGGDMTAGYLGQVSTDDLWTGDELATACGITQGTSQFSTTGWLKFAIDGKIIYKSQKTFRHSISWDHIHSKGCVHGTKTLTKNGITYKVRLMGGWLNDPSSGYDGVSCHGSEWNRLMLPIHVNAPNSWNYPNNVSATEKTVDWGINFTDADLQTHHNYGNGSCHWGRETYSSSNRVIRGYGGVSLSGNYSSSLTDSYYGWSPVLEIIS